MDSWLKYRFLNASLLCTSVLIIIPNMSNGNPSIQNAMFNASASFNSIAYELLDMANRGNIKDVEQQLKNIAEILEHSDDAMTDSVYFLQSLLNTTNVLFGTSLTLIDVLQLTREQVNQWPLPQQQTEAYKVGFDLIGYQQATLNEHNSLGLVHLAKHKKKNNSNFWTWLSIATIAAAAVTVSIAVPQAAIPIINGAVEIGKTIIDNK